jgi:hypothetical protein
MRSAKNFRAVKDYGAAKGILVAMAIGAIASGQVILSLVDVSIDQASVVLQTLAAPPNLRSRRRRLQGYTRNQSSNPQWIQESMIAWLLP